MLPRTILVAAVSAAAAIAVTGGTTASVVLQASDTGVEKSATGRATAAEHRSGAGGEASAEAGAKPAAVTPPPCPADVKNHGAYVSSVAKRAEHGKPETPGAHGALVSAAAQSDCGKPEGAENEAAEDADDAAKAPKAPKTSGKSGESHGQSTTHPTRQANPTT
jgi:hypothetical protein